MTIYVFVLKMPDYYLIPETADITPDEPIRGWSKSSKPKTYVLLLPSIHASRNHNVLHAGDPSEAVTDLLAACNDSTYWPSSQYCCSNQNFAIGDSKTMNGGVDFERPQVFHKVEVIKQEEIREVKQPKLPVYAKYRPACWSQDISDPHVVGAARSLFFERKKQRAVYESSFSSRDYHSGSLRMPTDYELFVAWASLSRSEKMMYISEVTGDWSAGSIQQPTNTLETERAINVLYSCSPDAASWPSLEYLRLRQNPYPPIRVPRSHQFHYPAQHSF